MIEYLSHDLYIKNGFCWKLMHIFVTQNIKLHSCKSSASIEPIKKNVSIWIKTLNLNFLPFINFSLVIKIKKNIGLLIWDKKN